MTPASEIEKFDRIFRRVYKTYVFGFLAFMAAWVLRFTVMTIGTLPEWLDWGFAGVLILTLPIQFYTVVRMNTLKKRGMADAELSVLFTDERIRSHEKAAWKFGFLAMAGTLGVLGVISVFASFKDTNAVIFTALWSGFGGYHLSFFLLEKD